MKSIRLSQTLAVALVATLALAGCKKEEAAPPPVVAPAPTPAPPPPPAPVAATTTITGVALGNTLDAAGQVSAPVTEFAPTDAINASISTATSDPAATVAGSITTKWYFEDGQVVHEEIKSFSFTGTGVTNFQLSKPDGWPAGGYKLEVSLDGNLAQTVDFRVK